MAEKNTIRVQVDRSFRLSTSDGMTVVNPGDVVDVNRETYLAISAANRAHQVADDTPLRRGQGYVAPYKRERLGLNKAAAAKAA
jgi:hypothetical protein